jgi:Predicted outer membrane protein
MHPRSTRTTKLTAVVAIVAAGTMLGACQRAENARTDTTAAGEVARHDSLTDTTRARTTPANPTATNNDGWTDAQILAYTAAADSAEIAQARLAEKKATNPAVKAFAREMLTDHQMMRREGRTFASSNKITPDTTRSDVTDLMKDSHDAITDWTTKAAGKDWDGAYMDKQIDEHKAVLDKLQNFEKATNDAKLKDMLNKAVGKVQSHLTKAQDVKDNKLKA